MTSSFWTDWTWLIANDWPREFKKLTAETTYGLVLKFGISRVCDTCDDWDDYVTVWVFDAWEFTDVAVADRTGWIGKGLAGFELLLLESVCAEFTTVFWLDEVVEVDDEVDAKEEVEDAEVDDEEEIDAWPWLEPETEFITAEVEGSLLDWNYAWVYVVTVLRLVRFPWRILFWK